MAELAEGLGELHRLKIAHGDPAFMNAYVGEAEETLRAVWVDLNTVHAATPEAIAVDIAAFESTTLWPALIDAESHSPSLFRELVAVQQGSADPLSAYATILNQERRDHVRHGARADLIESLANLSAPQPDDLLASTRRRMTAAMAPSYFLLQTRSDHAARFLTAALDVERERHLLLDEERTRLHGIRYTSEIDDLRRQLADMGATTSAAREAARLAVEQSQSLRQDLATERALATELGNENARLRNSLNEIYLSRAWRMVNRLRGFAALPSKAIRRLRPTGPIAPPVESKPTSLPGSKSPAGLPPMESYPYLVSVIMPVYNKGATLRASLDSVKAQTLVPVEIVVWDDGSTDPETLRVLEEIRGIPDVALFRAENQGVVGARNSAIAVSRGRYICCLDPDDEIAPTYLEHAVALLESQPEYAITYPWVHSTGAVDELWQTHDLEPSLITRHNHIPVCAVVRREVFVETGGFSPEMVHGYEDWELWVHAAELGFRGKAIPAHHLKYRIDHDPTQSRDAKAKESHQQLIDTIARLHPRLAKTGVPLQRPVTTTVRPVGPELGPRRLPAGSGRPIVLTLPWFTTGGADRVIEALVRHWVADGRTVMVFMTTPLAHGMADRKHAMEQLTPYVYRLHDFLPTAQWYEFFAATLAALDSPVVLNIGSAWFYDSARAVRRDFPQIRIVDQQFNSLAHQPNNRRIAELVDLTIAAYADLATDLAEDGRATDVQSVYVAIDAPEHPSAEAIARFRETAGLRSEERIVLFVGRLADEKRPEWVIALGGELGPDEARIVMIGDGPLRENIIEEVRSNSNLLWIPDIDAIEPAIAAADVVVLPSKIEGIPLVALEALALGTPLVATRVGGLPDLEGEEGVTLADADDFAGFAEAVRKALSETWNDIRLPARFSESEMLESYDRLLFGSD